MAKKSAIERDKKRARLAKQYSGRRERLKAAAKDPNLSPEERFNARLKLAELPRNAASSCRKRTRRANNLKMRRRMRAHNLENEAKLHHFLNF